MTVKLVANEKVAETSSKGNQEKWFDSDTNKWYKLDQFGYEALTETVISKLLEKSNIESDTPFSFAPLITIGSDVCIVCSATDASFFLEQETAVNAAKSDVPTITTPSITHVKIFLRLFFIFYSSFIY